MTPLKVTFLFIFKVPIVSQFDPTLDDIAKAVDDTMLALKIKISKEKKNFA